MSQDEQARRPLTPDFELVAPPSPPALVQVLVGDTLVVEVLLDEDGGSLDILPSMLYAEGVVACREGKKERCASSREGIEHPQAFCELPAVSAREDGDVEQYMSEDFVGLAFVAARLGHLQRDERGEAWLQRAQERSYYLTNVREIFVRRACCTQARENGQHVRYVCVIDVHEQMSLACEHYRLDGANGSTQPAGEESGRRQGRRHIGVLGVALRRDDECKFHVGEYNTLSGSCRPHMLAFCLNCPVARVFLKGIQGSVQAYLPLGPDECPLGPGGYPPYPGGWPLCPDGCPSRPSAYLFAQSADPIRPSGSPLYCS